MEKLLLKFQIGVIINLRKLFPFLIMEKTNRQKKKILTGKIISIFILSLMIILFCVAIIQTVKINNLKEKLTDYEKTYNSVSSEEK